MTTATQQQLPAATWGADPVHSSAGFAIKYMVGTFRAEFARVDASLDTTGDEPRLSGEVRADSLQLKDENFFAHLQSPEFFDAENHPDITFESTSFRIDGNRVEVDGDFTVKGVTRPVQARGELVAPFEDPFGGTRIGLRLEAVIDRTQFGVTWNNPLPKGGLALANEVRLLVDLQLVQA